MQIREDEVDSLAEEARMDDLAQIAEATKILGDKFILVMEKIFDDLNDNITSTARNCRCSDASTALYELSSAINMMDVPFLVREALKISHSSLKPEKRRV